MFKRIHFRYCVPLLLLCVFAVTLSLVHSQNVSRQTRVRVVDYSEEEIANILANAEMQETIQMLPTAQRVLLLSTETLDESFRKLATYDDGQYFEPGYTTDVMFVETDLKTLLSNRRVIKIMQDYEKLPLEQARAKAKEFHQIAMNNISRVVNTELDEYEKTGEPLPIGNDDQHAKYMTLTSLLLTASLGDIPLVIQQMEAFGQGPADVKKRYLKKRPADFVEAYSKLEYSRFVDVSSLVSILMFAVEQNGTQPEIVKRRIAEADCRIEDIPLVAWDAKKTYFDDIRLRGEGLISWENTHLVFRVYSFSWLNESERLRNFEFYRSLEDTIASVY